MQMRTMRHAAIAAALAVAAGGGLAGSAQAASSPTLSPANSIGDGRLAITPIPIPGSFVSITPIPIPYVSITPIPIPGTQLPPRGGTGPVSG